VGEARSLAARSLVAAGGGKAIDAARAAAAEFGVPFVSCPTICSTDAPTSALSVIYAEAVAGHGVVEGYEIHRRSPDLVLVDSRVIAESPPRTLAAGIGDAVSTYYEARAAVASGRANMRGGRATLAAMALATLCRDTIFADAAAALADCRRQEPTAALERVIEAATLLSGLGFESAGLAAAHAIHNGLAALDALHGEKVAFGTLVQLMLEAEAPASSQLDPARSREEALALVRFLRAVGLPCTLAGLGVSEAERDLVIEEAAERAVRPGETIHAMPFPINAVTVARAIRAADHLGRG
jgi:glycerol dehydrogenase